MGTVSTINGRCLSSRNNAGNSMDRAEARRIQRMFSLFTHQLPERT